MAESHPNPNPCSASAYHFIQRKNAEVAQELASEWGNLIPDILEARQNLVKNQSRSWSRFNTLHQRE